MNDFRNQELRCYITFESAGPFWHLWTPEDHPIIFTSEAEFKAAMNIVGVCARLFPRVRIYTFEWMSNHLHIMLSGAEPDIHALFNLIKECLKRQLKSWGRPSNLLTFECKLREINSLEDARNVIVYDNRNGFFVTPSTSPFTYPWGANRYYFNSDAQDRYRQCRKKMIINEIRNSIRGRFADKIEPLYSLDGYACPMDFCNITAGQNLFRDARHYFFAVSRNVESQKKIAAEIGERIFYTDDELFAAISAISKARYETGALTLLPAQAKIEVAKLMHYEYNAGNKQIQRILRLDAGTVESLFPPLTR